MDGFRAGNRALRALLDESGWTQEALARAVNAAAAEVGVRSGYDRTSVAHWLVGTRPRAGAVLLLAEVLSRRLGRAITPAMLGLDLGPMRASAPAPASRRAQDVLADLVSIDADPRRCHSLARIPYELGLPDAAGPADQRRGAPPLRVGAAEVRALDLAVDVFATLTDSLGGGHGRTALAVFLADDVTGWLHAHATDADRDALLTGAARLVLLLARTHIDHYAHGLAQRYLRTALDLATEADDHSTRAIILRTMSTQAYDIGHPRTALRLAEAAESVARGTPAAVHAFLHAQLAVCRAADGDRSGTVESLAVAEQLGQRAGEPDSLFTSYSDTSLQYQRAQALSALHDHHGAVNALRISLRHRSPTDIRAHALIYADLAKLQLRIGHLQEACVAWDGFLDIYPRLNTVRADRELAQLRQGLRPHQRQPAAQQVLVRARTLGSAA